MRKMLTPQQVQKVYEDREPDKPYVIEHEFEGKLLVFFGSVHNNDPQHVQWQELEKYWSKFLAHPNKRKVVLVEGHAKLSASATKEQALERGESTLGIWMARQANIAVNSPEPDRVREVYFLRDRFSTDQILAYYFGRQMHQWYRQDRKISPDWRLYAEDLTNHLNELRCWDEQITLDKALAAYKQETGKDFEPEDYASMYALSDPYQYEVSAASGDFRDELLMEKIKKMFEMGNDLFIIFGSGHAIKLEPAIKELISNKQSPPQR